VASKNATVHIIKKSSENETIRTAQQLREEILKMVLNSSSPSTAALSFIKEEVRDFI
jgi:hypothetical protein